MTTISSDATMVKLTFRFSQSVNVANAKLVFRLNSPFKPDIIGANKEQPLGFAQYSNLYSQYVCYGSTFRGRFVNNGSANGYQVVVYPSFTLGTTDMQDAILQKYHTLRYLSPDNGGMPLAVFHKYMGVKKLLGRQTKDNNFSALVDANPIATAYWHVQAQDTLSSHIAISGYWTISIDYYIKFFDRLVLLQSAPS